MAYYDPSFLDALQSARDRLAELNTPLPERSPRRPVGPFETTTETIEKPFSFRDFLPSLPPASEPSGPLGMEGFPGLDQPDIAPPAPGAFDAASPPMPEPSPVRMPALPSAPGVSVVGAFDPGGIPEPAAAPEPPKQTPRGLLGESFGILTPEASKEAVAEKKRAALQRIAESEKAIADTEAFVAANPDLIKPSAFGTSQFANYDDIIKGRKEIIEEERRKLADIKGMERGEIAPPTKTKLRAAVESAPQSLISMGVALPVHYAGIVGGYVKQGIEAGLGTQIDAPDDNMVYRLGTQIDDFAKTVFPGDPARADEFGQKLAHGVGSLAAFYGSAGISVVTRLGPKAFHAIATKAPFIHGAAVAGASSFNEATEKMKEGKPVTEVDRLMGTIGQSVVGMSEALPVLSTLKAAKGAGSLRKAGTAATEGAIEEGAQELGQSIASDIAAQQTYDPERAIGETAGEEGVIGAILGAGAKVTGSAIGSAREKLARKANKPETDPDISAGTAENSSAAAAQTGNASAAAADEDIFEELPDEDVATPAKPAKAETASDLDEVAELLGAPTRVRNRVAQIEEPSSDRSGAATKLFGDAFNAEALATKGFDGLDRERQHMVLSHVRAALNDDKIFRAVVESVPVDVMNVLVGSKGPAKDLFHDKPVLTHRLSVPSDISIPQPIGRFIDSLATKIESASARLTAKEPGLRSEPSSVELPNDGRTALQASGRDVWHGTIGGEKVSVDINPSEKQKEAGNYLKGSVTPKTLGLKIAIETPKGTERRGVGEDGKPWTAVSQAHYGYIKGVEGKDGDAVDIYIGPELKSQQVTVVNQIDPKTGKLDEHKVLYGFADQAAAEAAYRGSFSDEVDRVGSIHTVPVAEFKEWLKSGDKTKEFAPAAADDIKFALTPKGKRGQTKAEKSAKLPAQPAEGVSEKLGSDSIAPGREGSEAAAVEPAPGGVAGVRAGVPAAGRGEAETGARDLSLDRTARRALGRIVRQESVRLDADGAIVTGRQSTKGRVAGESAARGGTQRVETTEPFRIGKYEGRVTAKALDDTDAKEGNLARLTYEIPGARTSSPAARAELVQRADGAWEVDSVVTGKPRSGLGTQLYDAIEKDLGIRMSPSGILTDAGLAFWKKRSPESVQWHAPSPTVSGFHISPVRVDQRLRRVKDELSNLTAKGAQAGEDAEKARQDHMRDLRAEFRQLKALAEEQTPEARAAKDTMFALRGFYSAAIRAAEGISQERGTSEQFWKQITKVPGVRKDELDWMGLEEFLKDKPSITKAEVLDFMRAHQVELDETILGDTITAKKELAPITAGEALSKVKWSEDWFEQAEAVWSYRVGDEQYYVTKNDDPENDGPYSLFYGDGNRMEGDPVSLDQARHMLDGVYGEEQDDPGVTRFADYKVPGGENYRELLIRLPKLGETKTRDLTPEEKQDLADLQTRLDETNGRLEAAREESSETFDLRDEVQFISRQMRDIRAGAITQRPYESKHFHDQEIVHLRVDDRLINLPEPANAAKIRERILDLPIDSAEAKAGLRKLHPTQKVLFVNEIQSDLLQVARKFGFGKEGAAKASEALGNPFTKEERLKFVDLQDRFNSLDRRMHVARVNLDLGSAAEREKLFNEHHEMFMQLSAMEKTKRDREQAASKYIGTFGEKGAPKVPFSNDTAVEIAVKRALLYAAEGGYDAVSWARSDQIAKAVGADQADLALQYDQKIGKFLDRYTKKWGGKVESIRNIAPSPQKAETPAGIAGWTDVDTSTRPDFAMDGSANPILRITPEMRASVLAGQPLAIGRGDRGYRLTPEFANQREKVFADIEAEIARMAPDAKVRFKDLPPGIEGSFVEKLGAIFIALRAADPRLIGDHEVIHAARAMNLISPEEWGTLMEAVEKHGWIAKHGVNEDYLQLAQDRGLSEAEALDMLYEEAIAWEFAEWRKGRRPAATAWGRIFKRLADFIDRIAKALKLSKIEAFEQVFEMVERGPEARRRDLRQERQAQQNRADLTERILGRFPGVAVEDIEQAVAAAESRFAIRFRRQKGPDVEKIARDWATLIAEPIETAIGQYRVRRTASAGKGTAKYEIFYGDKLIGDAILTPPIERMKVPAEIVQIETMVERSRGVLGALGLRRRPDLSRFQRALPAGSVSRINLDEAYRRKGIGSALYAAMDADLRSVGAELFPSETHITKGGKALWLKYDPQRLLEFYDAEGLPKFHDDYLEAKVAVRDRARRDPGQDGNVAHFPRSGNKGRLAVIEKRIIRIYEDLNQAMEERYAIEEKGALTHADESRIAEIGAQIDSLEEERRTLAVERDELHEMLAAAQIDSGLFEQRDEAKEAERQLRYERHGIEKNIEELERKVAETPDDFQARRNLQLAKRRLNEVVGEEAEARSRLDKLNRELADIRFALSGRPKIDADIVNAYRRALDRNRPGNKWVYLKDLREGLPGYSREEIDTALKRLWVERTGGITAIDLSIQDDQGSLTEAQRAAATKFGASRQDMISIDSGSPLINLQASAKQRPLRMDDFDDDAAFALAGRRPRSSAVGRAYEEFFDGYAGLEPESRRYMRNRSRGYFERAAGAFGSQLQSTRITWQDGFLPVRRLQEAQERENKLALPEDMQPYLKEELYHSRLQTRIEEFEEHHVEPLKRAIAKSGLDLAQVELYLYARHAEERNRQIASINPKMPDGGSGMDTADAQQILSAIRRSSKRAEYERIAGFVDAINAAKLDARVDYGLMSQDDADTLRNAYQHYVPLKGDPQHDDERMPEPVNLPKGFSVTNKDMVRAMGRRSRAHDLIARSIQDYLETMVRGERNRVAQALYEMLRAYPMPEVAVIDTPKMKRFIDKRTGMQTALVANAPVQTAKQFKEMVREQADPLAFLDPNTMSVMVDGERHMIRFLVPELRDAMMNLGTPQGMGLIKAAWAFNRFIAMASTSLNPSFALPNFMRDFQAAGINLTADGHKKAFRRVLGNSVRAMKAITAVEAGRGKGQWADLYRDLKEVGGTTGFYSLTDWEGQQKQLEKDIRLLRAGLLNPAKQANAIFKGFKTVVGGFNNIFENATRLAAYKIALDEGLSQEKAASLAKNITVNFNRRGRLDTPAAKLVMAAYLFANPSIQGSHRLAKAMKDATPGRRYAILASLVGLGALTALYNVLIGAALGDDEEKNIYETTSDYDRANNWMFLNPFAERKEGISGRDAVALKIPMPYGYGAIVNWGRLAMEHAISEHTDLLKNKRSAGEVAGEMIAIMHGHFDPLGAHPSPLAAFAPTIAKPFVEMATNTKFHGGPVYPMQFDPSEPDTDLAWRTTPQIWKDLARSVNELGGGDDYHKGKLLGIETDFSPETFRHLGEFAIGGVGHEIARLFTMGERHYVTKEPIRLNDIPVIRRFVSDETGFGYSSDYYAVRDEQMKPYEDVRRDAGRGSEAAKAILPTLDLEKRLYPAYKRADKLLSVLRKDLKANDKARDDDKLTTEEWSKRQQDLYDRRQLTAMRFMVEYYAEGKLLDLEKDKSVPPQQRGKIAGQINRRRERARYNLSAIEQSIQGGTMHGKPPVADLSKIKNLAEKLRDGGGFLSPIEELID